MRRTPLALLLLLPAPAAAADAPPCAGRGTSLVVDTAAGRLHLCEGGRAVTTYPVTLGSSGVGKRRQGDKRTPLGTYRLGLPRGSKKYHRFIPVGYPTKAQRKQGFTGSAIGVHGPPRGAVWVGRMGLGRLLTLFDVTDGCIAVGTDEEIEEIERFVRAKKVRRIHLL